MTRLTLVEGAFGHLRNHLQDPLYRNSYFLMASLGLNATTGFAFWLAAAHLSSAHDMGLAAGMVSAVGFLSYVTGLGLPMGLLRFVPTTKSGLDSLVNAALAVSSVTSVLASVIFVLGSRWWTPDLGPLFDTAGKAALFVAFNVVVALGTLFDSFFAARRKAHWALIRSAIINAGRFMMLYLLLPLDSMAIYASMFVPVGLAIALLVPVLRTSTPGYRLMRISLGQPTRDLFTFCFRNCTSILLAGAPQFVMPLVALVLAGPANTAHFYVAWSFASILQLLPSVIAQMTVSEGSRGDTWELAKKARRFATTIAVPAVGIILLLASPLLSLYGPDYQVTTGLLRLLAIASLPYASFAINLSVLRVESRDRDALVATTLFAVLSLGSAAILTSAMGILGIGVGWLISTTVCALALEVWTRRLRNQAVFERGPRPQYAHGPKLNQQALGGGPLLSARGRVPRRWRSVGQ